MSEKLTARQPARFFQKELAPEEPPSLATMQALYSFATPLLAREPWNLLNEEQLILFDDEGSGERCFCSVLGALGEVFAVHVYRGTDSYRCFEKAQSGETMTIDNFFAPQRTVFVEFVKPRELTPPDKEVLKALGDPLKRGMLCPIFRAIRPGYHAWYVTEDEARILTEGEKTVIAMCDVVRTRPDADFWNKRNVYPLLTRVEGKTKHEVKYGITPAEAPRSTPSMPKAPDLDEGRIQRIREQRLSARGILQVDHFYGAGMVGEKHARKAFIHVVMAIDAETACAYPPEAFTPETPLGDVLARVVLRAIETARALPTEIHVRNRQVKILLGPLAQALGFPLRVRESLPALDYAKSHLLEMMER